MGRKKIEFNWDKFDGMLLFDASKKACAYFLDVSLDTIEVRVKEKYKLTFTEYKKTILERTILKLKQTMIKKAFAGDNVCLIFTLKNLSDWSDKQEVKHLNEKEIKIILDKTDMEM